MIAEKGVLGIGIFAKKSPIVPPQDRSFFDRFALLTKLFKLKGWSAALFSFECNHCYDSRSNRIGNNTADANNNNRWI